MGRVAVLLVCVAGGHLASGVFAHCSRLTAMRSQTAHFPNIAAALHSVTAAAVRDQSMLACTASCNNPMSANSSVSKTSPTDRGHFPTPVDLERSLIVCALSLTTVLLDSAGIFSWYLPARSHRDCSVCRSLPDPAVALSLADLFRRLEPGVEWA